MIKQGKEVKTTGFKNYNMVFGCVNNKQPKTVYINLSAWAEPTLDDVNYSRIIRNLNKQIKQSIFNMFDSEKEFLFDKEKTIVDLDIRESGIRLGKRSFMSCEITLFLKELIPINTDYMKDRLTDVSINLINSVFEKDKYFNFHLRKR